MSTPPFPPPEAIWAAGGVTRRTWEDADQFLVVHRPRYNDWSLPKGKLDAEETFIGAAVREVEEETGHRVEAGASVGTVGYRTSAGKEKVVRWWLMETSGGQFRPNAEVDEIAWVTRGKAVKMLSYRNDRKVLRRADDLFRNPSSGRIYLIRHAWAGDKRRWNGDDRERGIDKRGRQQALALQIGLSLNPLTKVMSSGFTRCVETVKPTATALGLATETDRRLSVGATADDVRTLIRDLRGESAVVCTHGEIIGPLIGGLDADGVPLDGPREWPKGSVWVLETRKGRVRSGRYVPPVR